VKVLALALAIVVSIGWPLAQGQGHGQRYRNRHGFKPSHLKIAPLGYFKQNCASCHGENGAKFGPGLRNKSEADLKATIERMAATAKAPLNPEDLAAQVAYHRAIAGRKPFAAWTGRAGNILTGEMTPGAKVTASIGKVSSKSGTWKIELPDGATPDQVVLTVASGSAKLKLELAASAYVGP
jgi:hypothetical protein